MSAVFKPRSLEPVSDAQRDESAASESLIDRFSHFNGVYRTSHDLRIEGSAEGEIECEGTLTVAPDAHIDAKVRANNVIIAGAASGEITCDARFTLRPSGHMQGQVRAASLVVEEGAFFEGEFQMSDGASAPRPAQAASAAYSAPSSLGVIGQPAASAAPDEDMDQDDMSDATLTLEGFDEDDTPDDR